jgi:ubiquinone/menaquinone biosynthesis C-methylase UbiE
MTPFDNADSPLVRYYDVFSAFPEGDVSYYADLASQSGGPVLELACGTGRVLIPSAQAGATITGLDLSRAMLDRTRQKIAALPAEVQQRVTLVEGIWRNFRCTSASP